ncbi:hypothetical protein MHBO_005143 [Bonamia ostreae]|uniref:Uncharacterized protein n=1 Tax=Bonamia ostreae TaxID=126728 RepID=A0ABV2AV68_9EUKA
MDREMLYDPNDLSCIIKSRQAEEYYDLAKSKFELQDAQVLPVINYTGGHTQDAVRDVFALSAMNSILQEAISYIENNA